MVGKSVGAFAIVLAFRYPVHTALHDLGEPGADRRVLVHPRRARRVARPAAARRGRASSSRARCSPSPSTRSRSRGARRARAAGSARARACSRRSSAPAARPIEPRRGHGRRAPARPRHHRGLRARREHHRRDARRAGSAVRGGGAGPRDLRGPARARAAGALRRRQPRRRARHRRILERARLLVVTTPDPFQARAILDDRPQGQSRHRDAWCGPTATRSAPISSATARARRWWASASWRGPWRAWHSRSAPPCRPRMPHHDLNLRERSSSRSAASGPTRSRAPSPSGAPAP